MTASDIADRAALLERARAEGRPVEQLTKSEPGLPLEAAYRIQDEGIRLRVAGGDAVAGYKMGLTSEAKMAQMGVREPIAGVLLRSMRAQNAGTFALQGLIHPRIEAEIAFVLGRELRGRVTRDEAAAACDGVAAALEIVDSRFQNFKFTLPDVVADNCSSCGFVLGAVRPMAGLDLKAIPLEMSIDGKAVQRGSSADILGDPVLSLAALASMMAGRGLAIAAGSVVLAGAATQAVPLTPGAQVSLAAGPLGPVSVRAI